MSGVVCDLALDLIANRPGPGEEFPNSDSLLIGLIVMKFVANERGDTPATAEWGMRAAAHRPDWQGVQRNLLGRQAEYRKRAGHGGAPGRADAKGAPAGARTAAAPAHAAVGPETATVAVASAPASR